MSNILNAIMNRTELQTFRDQRVVWKLSDVMACAGTGPVARAGRQAACRTGMWRGAGGRGASGVNALCIPFLLLIFDLLHYVIKI